MGKSHINYTLHWARTKRATYQNKNVTQFLHTSIWKEKPAVRRGVRCWTFGTPRYVYKHARCSSSGLYRGNSWQLKRARKHLSFKSFVSAAALRQNRVIAAALASLLNLPYSFNPELQRGHKACGGFVKVRSYSSVCL